MSKKTIYYARDVEEAGKILAVLKANGLAAEEKSLGEHVYHDIYGGNGAYGREILVEEEEEEKARAAIQAWLGKKENNGKERESSGISGTILIGLAVFLVVILLLLR